MTAKKFDFIIGNPPYNRSSYLKFMQASYKLGDIVELVTQAKFMFGNKDEIAADIMKDPHIKLVRYYKDAKEAFPKDITFQGGVAITLRDDKKKIGPIKILPEELKDIIKKSSATENLSKRSYDCNSFYWSEKFSTDLHDLNYKYNNLHSNCFKEIGNRIFIDEMKGPQASSLKPQASSLKPQASSLKPQASSLKPQA